MYGCRYRLFAPIGRELFDLQVGKFVEFQKLVDLQAGQFDREGRFVAGERAGNSVDHQPGSDELADRLGARLTLALQPDPAVQGREIGQSKTHADQRALPGWHRTSTLHRSLARSFHGTVLSHLKPGASKPTRMPIALASSALIRFRRRAAAAIPRRTRLNNRRSRPVGSHWARSTPIGLMRPICRHRPPRAPRPPPRSRRYIR